MLNAGCELPLFMLLVLYIGLSQIFQAISLFLVTLQNLMKDPIVEDATYLCHKTWGNQSGTNHKLHPYWAAFTVLEGKSATRGGNQQYNQAMNPVDNNNHWPGKICPTGAIAACLMGITNHYLIGLNVPCIR